MTGNRKTQLYRIPAEGRLSGVCAGFADYFNMDVTLIRVLTVIVAFVTGFSFVFLAYIILWLVLEVRPESLYEDTEEETFWKETRKDPSYTATEIRRRFRDIERRTRDMEAYMTSKRFKLDRELRNLEK